MGLDHNPQSLTPKYGNNEGNKQKRMTTIVGVAIAGLFGLCVFLLVNESISKKTETERITFALQMDTSLTVKQVDIGFLSLEEMMPNLWAMSPSELERLYEQLVKSGNQILAEIVRQRLIHKFNRIDHWENPKNLARFFPNGQYKAVVYEFGLDNDQIFGIMVIPTDEPALTTGPYLFEFLFEIRRDGLYSINLPEAYVSWEADILEWFEKYGFKVYENPSSPEGDYPKIHYD